jgi:hypothetical protein
MQNSKVLLKFFFEKLKKKISKKAAIFCHHILATNGDKKVAKNRKKFRM